MNRKKTIKVRTKRKLRKDEIKFFSTRGEVFVLNTSSKKISLKQGAENV